MTGRMSTKPAVTQALERFFTENSAQHRLHAEIRSAAVAPARAAAAAGLDLAEFALLVEEAWGEYIRDFGTYDDRLAMYAAALEALLSAFCAEDTDSSVETPSSSAPRPRGKARGEMPRL